MKYVDAFRDGELAKGLAAAIAREVQPGRQYRLMEFCGGHTHAIFRYGLPDLMPQQIEFVHGPGCPVCVLPAARIDQAIALAEQAQVMLCVYGDLLRVPAGHRDSLQKAKARGADIRLVYSPQEALKLARSHPEQQVVFFAIGFETTTPPTAVVIKQAHQLQLRNFTVFCNHVLTPAAMRHLLSVDHDDGLVIDGFLGPSHVSTVIGSQPYEVFADTYAKPIVIAGFEPLDVMQSVLMLVRQLNTGRHVVENQYTRAVSREGNRKAQALVAEVFALRESFEWRGLGLVPASALQISDAFADYDAERRFTMPSLASADVKACLCPSVLRGQHKPEDCSLFGSSCTPEHPMGACMVSSEGACAAYWSYGRFRQAA